MGVFQRTSDILAANVNDLVDRFEQPEKMLRQAVRQLDAICESVQGALARSIAATRLLGKQRDEQIALVDRWGRRAAAAVARGDDALARRAIARKFDAQHTLEQTERHLTEAQSASEALGARLDALRTGQAEARRRLAAFSARAAVTAAQRQLLTAVRVDGGGGVWARIERLSERIELAEAEAAALCELELGVGAAAAHDFAERERGQAIDAEFERLKLARTS